MSDVRGTYHFARLPEWVLLSPDLDAIDIRVFCVLDRFDGRDCFPSLARVAERLRCSEDTVRRAIRRLQVVGAVVVERRIVEGRQTSNRYILAGDNPLPRVAPVPPRPGTDATPGGSTDATLPLARVPGDLEQEDLEQEDPTSAHRADERGRFDEFWKLYPRRVGKRAAVKAWDLALKRADLDPVLTPAELIMAAVRARAAWWAKARTPADKIPHASTWLNRDGWLDELEPTPAAAATGMVQKAADLAVRQRDEVDRAVAAGDADLAWKLTLSRAAASLDNRWFADVAAMLDTDRSYQSIQARVKRGDRKVTVDEIDQVRDAKTSLWVQCGRTVSPAIAQSSTPTPEGPP